MQTASGTVYPENLASRTKRFAVEIVRFYVGLPKSGVYYVLGRQLLKSRNERADFNLRQHREASEARTRERSIRFARLQRSWGSSFHVPRSSFSHFLRCFSKFVSIVKRAKPVPSNAA